MSQESCYYPMKDKLWGWGHSHRMCQFSTPWVWAGRFCFEKSRQPAAEDSPDVPLMWQLCSHQSASKPEFYTTLPCLDPRVRWVEASAPLSWDWFSHHLSSSQYSGKWNVDLAWCLSLNLAWLCILPLPNVITFEECLNSPVCLFSHLCKWMSRTSLTCHWGAGFDLWAAIKWVRRTKLLLSYHLEHSRSFIRVKKDSPHKNPWLNYSPGAPCNPTPLDFLLLCLNTYYFVLSIFSLPNSAESTVLLHFWKFPSLANCCCISQQACLEAPIGPLSYPDSISCLRKSQSERRVRSVWA